MCRAVAWFIVTLMLAPTATAAPKQARVVVYDGHGTPTSFRVQGRVLEDRGIPVDAVEDGATANIARTVSAIDSNELRGVDVLVTVGGVGYGATTDADGMFQVVVKNLPATASLPHGAQPVEAALDTSWATAPVGRGVVHVTRAGPTVGLVSDIDDTVVKTFVTDKTKMAREVLLKNATQLAPVVGASAAYQKARAASVDAVFYVSSSPQNLYPRLRQFLDRHGFPAGPVFLKNLEQDKIFGHSDYKLSRLEQIARAHPEMRFVLSGDSGEHDPEIYRAFRERYPDRVLAVIIRLVPGTKDLSPARFAGMVIVDDVWRRDDLIQTAIASSSSPPSSSTQPAH